MSAKINSFTQTMWDQFLCVRPIITAARTSSGEYTLMKAILLMCVGGFSLFWSYIVSHVLSSGSFKFYYKKKNTLSLLRYKVGGKKFTSACSFCITAIAETSLDQFA